MQQYDTQLRRFSDMDNVQVAEDDPDVRGWDLVLPDGSDIGEVKDLLVDTGSMKVRALECELEGKRFNWSDNRRVAIPIDQVELDDDHNNVIVNRLGLQEIGRLPIYSAERFSRDRFESGNRESERYADRSTDRARGTEAGRDRLTRSEEELRVGKRDVPAGEVVVGKHVETEHVSRDVPVERERVRIERRPITAGSERGSISDDEIRVPIREEEVVVDKRPVAKEELVISKERVTESQRVDADVQKERFDVDKNGRVIDERGRNREDR